MSSPPPDSPSKRERVRQVLPWVAAGLGALIAVLNLHEVRVNWVLDSFRTPLIVVIVVSFALGLGAGMLVERRGRRKG